MCLQTICGSCSWTMKGAVTPVKNPVAVPASCLACFTTGSLEGASLIATGNLSLSSEQHLVDLQIFKDHGRLHAHRRCLVSPTR